MPSISSPRLLSALLIALVPAGCSSDTDPEPAPADLPAGLATYPSLVEALAVTGIDDLLLGLGPVTLLAPTEAAFAELGVARRAELFDPANRAQLEELLRYHVLVGEATFSGFLTTLQGDPVIWDAGAELLNQARVRVLDLAIANVTVQEIDAVLRPPQDILSTLEALGFDDYLALYQASGLLPTLSGPGPLTVFLPPDLPGTINPSLFDPADPVAFVQAMRSSVAAGFLLAGEALAAGSAESINGYPLYFAPTADGMAVNGVEVLRANLPCTNGLLYLLRAPLPQAVLALAPDVGALAEGEDAAIRGAELGAGSRGSGAVAAGGPVGAGEQSGAHSSLAPEPAAEAALSIASGAQVGFWLGEWARTEPGQPWRSKTEPAFGPELLACDAHAADWLAWSWPPLLVPGFVVLEVEGAARPPVGWRLLATDREGRMSVVPAVAVEQAGELGRAIWQPPGGFVQLYLDAGSAGGATSVVLALAAR